MATDYKSYFTLSHTDDGTHLVYSISVHSVGGDAHDIGGLSHIELNILLDKMLAQVKDDILAHVGV